MSSKKMNEEELCEHGIPYEDFCVKCDDEIMDDEWDDEDDGYYEDDDDDDDDNFEAYTYNY